MKLKKRLKRTSNFQWLKHSWVDLKRNKAKTLFGVMGISISIALLTGIGMVNDTMNFNYMDMVTNQTGSADIWIMKTLSTDMSFDLYFNHSYVEDVLKEIEEIEEMFPRLQILPVDVNNLENNISGSIMLYGIDFEREKDSGIIGDLIIYDENLTETDEIYENVPEKGHCIILKATAVKLNASKGDTLHLVYQNKEIDLVIDEICVQDLKFNEYENNQIIMDIEHVQDWLNLGDQASMVMVLLRDREFIYDSSDIKGTKLTLRDIGEEIQKILTIEEYQVMLPKLEELEMSEFSMMGRTIMFWFVTLLSMLITGILINGILSTSAEERIREFGITRVLGGKKVYSIKMVLFEGFLLGTFGTIIGIIAGVFITPPFVNSLFDFFIRRYGENFEYIISPQTIILAIIIGIVVSVGVALIPALKVSRIKLIKAITPFQTKEEGWEVAKEGSMNVKGFLVGISIALIGLLIFILLPRIFTSMDIMLIAIFFIGLLAAIVLGLVFASLAIIPYIQTFMVYILKPFFRKYMNIVKISLKRYQRRNSGTILMFAISFSFIFFITTSSEIEKQTWSLNFKFQYGADLVLANYGTSEEGNAFTIESVEELKELQGVEEVAPVLHNSFDLTSFLSLLDFSSESGLDFNPEQIQTVMRQAATFSQYGESKFSITISDVVDFASVDVKIVGVDERYLNLVDRNLFIWKSAGSGFDASFSAILDRNDAIIISKAIAAKIGVKEVGQKVRLTVRDPEKGGTGNLSLFEVVGISGGVPGFINFKSSEMTAEDGGIMVSMDTYIELMNWPNGGKDMIVDKIFINLADPSEENIRDTKQLINDMYMNNFFTLDDAITKIKFVEEMNEQFSSLSEILLTFTVIICIFGLISSMYATILERNLEIGILRALGMRIKEVRNMFLLESMILMISAGFMGVLIGSYSAYLMESNLSLMTELPTIFSIPIDTIIRVFGISVIIGIIGMYLILLRLSRQTLMDIFRQTF
ncbi:MAG: FtsX-like permease family protein [Candidatus Lokiarchaeota archaeon]|nr:FtsX-like permease family protein [Candidatus Lokiarchaeota archaeon]